MKTTQDTTTRMSRDEKIRQTMLLISKFKRDEEGGLIIFSLYCFVIMLLIAGVAVDVMRFETERTMLQNTLDSASLAATSMRQQRDSEELVKDFMRTRGYDPDKVTVTVDESRSGATETDDGELLARKVKADYPLRVNTILMPLIGIQELGTTSSGAASERVQNVDISLVVDISGSMDGQKLRDLKRSAIDFFGQVIDEDATEGIVSVSLIPYNHTVVVPDELLSRLNTQLRVEIPAANINADFLDSSGAQFPGTATEYDYNHAFSRCVRWSDAQMTSYDMEMDYQDIRAVSPTTLLDMMASYDPGNKSRPSGGSSYDQPANESNRRCDPTRSSILAYQTTVQPLVDHVNAMYADGWTAVDHGMKWGVALLDPAFRPILSDMITQGERPAKLAERPFDYGVADALKVVVLMTDGKNTSQYDLKSQYKRGPSRIWYSKEASADSIVNENGDTVDVRDEWIVDRNKNGVRDREKRWYDGYYVLMPDNSDSRRWMRPHKPWDDDDGARYAEDELPNDAEQLTYTELYERFSENAVAAWFDDDNYGDWRERNRLREAETVVLDGGDADDRLNGTDSLEGICDAAKVNGEIRVFTLAFGSGADLSEMRKCASSDDDAYYADDGDSLSEAFSAIAGAIIQLRLTQ